MPGHTALTRMRSRPYSMAAERVSRADPTWSPSRPPSSSCPRARRSTRCSRSLPPAGAAPAPPPDPQGGSEQVHLQQPGDPIGSHVPSRPMCSSAALLTRPSSPERVVRDGHGVTPPVGGADIELPTNSPRRPVVPRWPGLRRPARPRSGPGCRGRRSALRSPRPALGTACHQDPAALERGVGERGSDGFMAAPVVGDRRRRYRESVTPWALQGSGAMTAPEDRSEEPAADIELPGGSPLTSRTSGSGRHRRLRGHRHGGALCGGRRVHPFPLRGTECRAVAASRRGWVAARWSSCPERQRGHRRNRSCRRRELAAGVAGAIGADPSDVLVASTG